MNVEVLLPVLVVLVLLPEVVLVELARLQDLVLLLYGGRPALVDPYQSV